MMRRCWKLYAPFQGPETLGGSCDQFFRVLLFETFRNFDESF